MMYPRYLDFLPWGQVQPLGVPWRNVTPHWYAYDDPPGAELWVHTPRGSVAAFFDTTGNGRIEDLRT